MCDQEDLDRFLSTVDPSLRPTVERLATVIMGFEPSLECSVKWGRFTFARGGDYHHWLCGIGVTKRAVSLTFHFGGLLSDPARHFIVGSSKFGRKLEYRRPEEVDAAIVLDFISQALGRLDYFKQNWKAIQAGDVTDLS